MSTPLELILFFTRRNPEYLGDLAHSVAQANLHFAHRGLESIKEDGAEIFPRTFYSYYPLLFEPLFPTIKLDQYPILVSGSHFLSLWCFLLDNIVDREPGIDRSHFLTVGMLPEEARHHYRQLFSDGTGDFWHWYGTFEHDFIAAMLEEGRLSLGVGPSLPQARRLAIGKSACAKVVPTAMALLARYTDVVEHLHRSHDWFAVGRQLLDDLEDWREDLRTGTPSYLLNCALTVGRSHSEDVIGEAVSSQLRRSHLKMAYDAFLAAQQEVQGLPECGWSRWIQWYLNRLEDDLDQRSESVKSVNS